MTLVRPHDPLRTYSFHLKMGEKVIAGMRKVSGLTMSVQAHEIWSGGNSMHRYAQPDRANWEPITLEQGLALDNTLERWAEGVIKFLHDGEKPTGDPIKRNLTLDVWDPQKPSAGFSAPGATAAAEVSENSAEPTAGGADPSRRRTYMIFNAWVSRYVALPPLDAMSDEVGLLLVELTHEGWRKDPAPA